MLNINIKVHPVYFVLFLVFLILKITRVINWSWWWVTAPLWIPVIILLIMVIIGFIWYKKRG